MVAPKAAPWVATTVDMSDFEMVALMDVRWAGEMAGPKVEV